MGFLNLDVRLVGYEDTPFTSAPLKKGVDWTTTLRGLSVESPGSTPLTPVPPGGSVTLLNGIRTLTLNNSTNFLLTLSPLSPTQYFLTWDGVSGTAPGFRVDRALTLSGSTLAVTPQANGSVLLDVTAGGGTFSDVQLGDNVFIPGVTTGAPSGPFNPNNEGLWVVLNVTTDTELVLVRPPGSSAGYFAQTGVVLSTNTAVQAYSSAGVQVGDDVDISGPASLPSPLISTFNIVGVTANQLTIQSTNPLPLVAIAPSIAGMVVYSQAFSFVYLEADQNCAVQANGDTGQTQRLSPWVAGRIPGQYMKVGPTWQLVVENRSVNPLNLTFISGK